MDERQSLLQILRKKSETASSGNPLNIQIFDVVDVMMEKFASYKERIDQEYKDKILTEKERASRAETERDAAKQMQNATTQQLNELKNRVQQLEIDLRNERDVSRMLKLSEKPDAEDKQEEQHRMNMMKKITDLTSQVTSLQKKLSEAPKQKVVQTRSAVPSFSFTPTRDSEGRIVSVTATPIGG